MLNTEHAHGAPMRDSRGLTEFFKGVAVFLVILVHSHQIFGLTGAENAIQRFGQMGCQIFFVLSSFGLCHSYSGQPLGWFSFFKKRVAKLAIGYWVALILHAIYRTVLAISAGENVFSALNLPGILVNALFLNGLVPIREINNSMVRGGWYVGTTVILYALFPLLYKLYFGAGKRRWERLRIVLFPMAVLGLSSFVLIAAEQIDPMFACTNNSFAYFSFVNQLTPFALGLALFDASRRFRTQKWMAFLLALLPFSLSVVLFFAEYRYSFVFCPTLVALGFAILYWGLLNSRKLFDVIHSARAIPIRIVRAFGKVSYAVYLTHFFIVYDLVGVCLLFLRPLGGSELFWHLALLPAEIALVYFVGYVYNQCTDFPKKHR